MKKSFRQEDLKFLACMTMLIDHVGTVFFPDLVILRIIGRLAFPLYGFLLVQGVRYSADKLHYGIRLGLALLIAEIPFDFVFYGGPTWGHQSVMHSHDLDAWRYRKGKMVLDNPYPWFADDLFPNVQCRHPHCRCKNSNTVCRPGRIAAYGSVLREETLGQ